jgi:Amt family ammonium transporter
VPFGVNGLFYTGSAHQLWEQFRAAIFVILWSAVITFILMKLIGLVLRGTRYKDEILEVGDLAIHGEEAFPEETFAERVGAMAMAGDEPRGGGGGGELTVSASVDDKPASKPGDWPPNSSIGL